MPKGAVQRSIESTDAPPAYAPPPSQVTLPQQGEASSSQLIAPTSSNSSISRTPAIQKLPEDQAKQNLAQFGSPYATNADWSPSEQELRLRKLPSLAFTMRLQQRFAKKTADIFNPPCPSLQRPVPNNISEANFHPYQCLGRGDLAADGFKSTFLGAVMTPRDVSTADWFRFLQDLTVASRLSGPQEALAGITPVTKRLSLPGFLVTKLIRYSVIRKREPLIFDTVEEWNARFFSTRGIDVFIHNGSERLTSTTVGGAIPPLEAKFWRNSSNAAQLVATYSDSDSDFEDGYGGGSMAGVTSSSSSSSRQGKLAQRENALNQRQMLVMQQRGKRRGRGDEKIMMLAVAHRSRASEPGPALLAEAILSEDQQEVELPIYSNPPKDKSTFSEKS